MNLRRFEMELDRFSDDIDQELVTMQRILSIAALNGLVLRTPVDTGRARGAWMTSVDIEINEAPAEAPDSMGSARKGAQAGAGSAAITAGLGVIGGAPPFSNIIIQNNVEYIEDLEDGGSKQAPAGMLAVTVAEIERIFR